jgi:hypothetical protein
MGWLSVRINKAVLFGTFLFVRSSVLAGQARAEREVCHDEPSCFHAD